MRLSELIEDLKFQLAENGDMEVMTSSNYGDYHNTEQLDEIAEITPCIPVESAYSHTGLTYPSDQDREDEEEEFSDPEVQRRYKEKTEKEPVLVLRYTSK